jgi:hypothetical protein
MNAGHEHTGVSDHDSSYRGLSNTRRRTAGWRVLLLGVLSSFAALAATAAGADAASLNYYYTHDGSPTYNHEVIVPSASGFSPFSAPAIAYNSHVDNTEIAAEGPSSSLIYYYNHDGSPTWTKAVITGGTTISAPAMVFNSHLDNTEITAQGSGGSLFYYYNHDGLAYLDSVHDRGVRGDVLGARDGPQRSTQPDQHHRSGLWEQPRVLPER